MTTDLATTGPEMMELRWGRPEQRDDGTPTRAFFPRSDYHQARGYLHPGVLAAGMLGAARTVTGLPTPVASVSVAQHRLVPLGADLRVDVHEDDDTIRVELRHVGDVATEEEPIDLLAVGEVRGGEPAAPPNLGEWRSFADVPIPDPEDHDLYAECWVCGANPQGLGLRPGWYAPDTVVNGFIANERMGEDGIFSPALTLALLACPTLWANRDNLDDRDGDAAVLATYEVAFLDDAKVTGSLRSVGLAGEAGQKVAETGAVGDDTLRGASALLGEGGEIHAVAHASWRVVDEEPGREPGGTPPAHHFMPIKGGRAEERSPEDEGQSLPGRREAPGPRSERPGDHDARDSQDFAHRSTGPSEGS